MGGCLVFWKLLLITPHSIFFTHHSSLKLPQFPKPHPFGTYFQLLITQCFLLFMGPVPEHLVKYFLMFMLFSASYFLFIYLFFLQPPIPKLIEPKLLSSTVHYHCVNHKTSNLSTIADLAIHTTNTFNTTTNYTIKLRKN